MSFVGFSCLTTDNLWDIFATEHQSQKMDNTSIKRNIRNIRMAKKMTQEEMAHRLGISLTAYRDFEKGNTAVMNANILKMARMLDTTAEELVLGYRPSLSQGKALEEAHAEYGNRITSLEDRVRDLEQLVRSKEEIILSKDEIIRTKNEIIAMLKKSLDEVK